MFIAWPNTRGEGNIKVFSFRSALSAFLVLVKFVQFFSAREETNII